MSCSKPASRCAPAAVAQRGFGHGGRRQIDCGYIAPVCHLLIGEHTGEPRHDRSPRTAGGRNASQNHMQEIARIVCAQRGAQREIDAAIRYGTAAVVTRCADAGVENSAGIIGRIGLRNGLAACGFGCSRCSALWLRQIACCCSLRRMARPSRWRRTRAIALTSWSDADARLPPPAPSGPGAP